MSTRSERTNVLAATAGSALVLVSPLSTLVTVAVVATVLGMALTHRLTANPVRIVRAEVPATPRRR